MMASGGATPSQRQRTIYVAARPVDQEQLWGGAREGKGVVKVGQTDGAPEKRVAQLNGVAQPLSQTYQLLWSEPARKADGTEMSDHEIHLELARRGFTRLLAPTGGKTEQFEATLEEVQSVYAAVRDGVRYRPSRRHSFGLRKEQQDAIDMACRVFAGEATDPKGARRVLWNAKMRFGKTYTTYKLAQKLGAEKVLVLTYKPAVRSAWYDDLMSHVDFEGWNFVDAAGTDGYTFEDLPSLKQAVCFASLQDLTGNSVTGGMKDKFASFAETKWDIVVVDEYHFGAWRETAAARIGDAIGSGPTVESEGDDLAAEQEQSVDAASVESTVSRVGGSRLLYLSGTPFRALASGEFLEHQIFNWTYSAEQAAKRAWDEAQGENPYAALPRVEMYSYKLGEILRDHVEALVASGTTADYSLNELFRVAKSEEKPAFVHPRAVSSLLDSLSLDTAPATAQLMQAAIDSKGSSISRYQPRMPFTGSPGFRNRLRHTLWVLPSVAACHAMASMLREHVVFGGGAAPYRIIVAAGADAGVGEEALRRVRQEIAGAVRDNAPSITLSCGKLLTGVSVPEWTGVMMMRDLQSAETYFQAAFRAQTPWLSATPATASRVLKDTCYLFDFAPQRSLQMLSNYAAQSGGGGGGATTASSNRAAAVAELLQFMPVYYHDGYSFSQLNAEDVLDVSLDGVAASMLARRWQHPSLISMSGDVLRAVLDDEEMLAALKNVPQFRNLRQVFRKTLAADERLSKLKKSQKGKTGRNAEIDAAQKALQAERKNIRIMLQQFLTRIPLFMYLTTDRESSLQEVIRSTDTELFTEVTGLTLEQFEQLCSLGLFVGDQMDRAVLAFRQYEAPSLEYAGPTASSRITRFGAFH